MSGLNVGQQIFARRSRVRVNRQRVLFASRQGPLFMILLRIRHTNVNTNFTVSRVRVTRLRVIGFMAAALYFRRRDRAKVFLSISIYSKIRRSTRLSRCSSPLTRVTGSCL